MGIKMKYKIIKKTGIVMLAVLLLVIPIQARAIEITTAGDSDGQGTEKIA